MHTDDTEENAISRINHVGGKHWLKKFKKRNELKTYEKKSPIEIERTRKAQLEITLNYFRLIIHVQALCLCHIHRRIASGVLVEGWILENGLVTRSNVTGNEPGDDVLEVRVENKEKIIFVIPLNERLT